MFSGLSAFPLTPMSEIGVDETAYISLIKRLVTAGVDSIGALGSTGNYTYLTLSERMKIARIAIENAEDIPVLIGIGSLRTKDVLILAEDAQKAGASALLLAPVSYQQLNDSEVYELYKTVNSAISIPICVYDNPGTTHFEFSDDLHARIAELSNIKSIKIPGVPNNLELAKKRVSELRAVIPADVSIGISGDASAAMGLAAGCDLWYSVIGGLFPNTAQKITHLVKAGLYEQALDYSNQLDKLWQLFNKHNGSLRVIAAAAEIEKLANSPCLPLPLLSVQGEDRRLLTTLIETLELH